MSSRDDESGSYEAADGEGESRGAFGIATAFFMLGVGCGAVAAMLVTPKTGRQMRRILKRRFEDARENVGDFADEAQDRMEDTLEQGGRWARSVAAVAKEKMGR